MAKAFASAGDTAEKEISFAEIGEGLYAFTAQGDPNSGVIVGDDSVMVIDAQATPVAAQAVIDRIRQVTDKPIRFVTLSHYHAVRVLGASAYGAHAIIASKDTHDLIVERGEQDKASEIGRFPRLFRGLDTVPPGLTWPDLVFEGRLVVDLGGVKVNIFQVGRGHTKGDTIAWLEAERILFSGDLVEFGATPYTGDAYLRDWPATLGRLKALEPEKLVPGRGDALTDATSSAEAIAFTRGFVTDLFETTKRFAVNGRPLGGAYKEVRALMAEKYGHLVIFEHCMPFDVSRAYDEATGIDHPRIWTDARDREMWAELNG